MGTCMRARESWRERERGGSKGVRERGINGKKKGEGGEETMHGRKQK